MYGFRFQSRSCASWLIESLILFGLLLFSGLPSLAQRGGPDVSVGVHAISPAVRDLPTNTEVPGHRIKPLHIFPSMSVSGQADGALQTSATSAVATTAGLNFPSNFASLLPADLDGASGATGTTSLPPTGTPTFLINFGTNSLNLWKFHVDFTTTNNSTLTGPTNIAVASFSPACNGGVCVKQPNTNQKLDSLGDRLMFRLAYRNFAGTHESLVVNHSVRVGTTKSNPFTGIRWYELRRTPSGSGSFSVFQQGTYSPNSTFRWMGSIGMDKTGNIAVGYGASSGSIFPSVRYTGRVPGDAAGTLEAETTLKAGAGSQLPNLNRWGDYSSISIDPSDDCTFFYTNEYLKSSGTFNWSTQIGSFKFPGCQ